MTAPASRVTIHLAASLDGFIARTDGSVDWLETADEYAAGERLEPATVEAFLAAIDCYVMGSRTYETALAFESRGHGWPYGDKPTYVLTHRQLPRTRATVEFLAGDLAALLHDRLRPAHRSIWVVGGANTAAQCLRFHLADELSLSILPIAIGAGIPLFHDLDRDTPLHLTQVKAYTTGMVELRYDVRRPGD